MADFLHVFIVRKQGINGAQVEKNLDLAEDWFRYSATTYILYTTSDARKWYRRLISFAQPEGSLFICRLDIETYTGWMTKEFFDWIDQKMTAR